MAGPLVVGRHGVVIGAPPQEVFNYLADMARHGEWNGEPDFMVTTRPEGRLGVGSVCRREKTGVMRGPLIIRGGMSDNPLRIVKTMTITSYDPYYSLGIETRNSYNGLLASIDKISFDIRQETEGSRVNMVSEVETMVPGGFLGPVFAIRVVRIILDRLLGDRSASMKPGPHLPRIKQLVETAQFAGEV